MLKTEIMKAAEPLLREFDNKWASEWPDNTRITYYVVDDLNNIDETRKYLTIGDLRNFFKKIYGNSEQKESEINIILHTARGLCWHEWEEHDYDYSYCDWMTQFICNKCREEQWIEYGTKPTNPDYSKWEHYGPLLEWAMKQEWWDFFVTQQDTRSDYKTLDRLLIPTLGSKALATFLST